MTVLAILAGAGLAAGAFGTILAALLRHHYSAEREVWQGQLAAAHALIDAERARGHQLIADERRLQAEERHVLLERIQRPEHEPLSASAAAEDETIQGKLWVSEDDEIRAGLDAEREQRQAVADAVEAELQARGALV